MTVDLPESPRVLYCWNEIAEADQVLCRLHGAGDSINTNENLAMEKQRILEAIRFEREELGTDSLWRNLFWDSSPLRNSRRLFIAVVLQALQQLGQCHCLKFTVFVIMN